MANAQTASPSRDRSVPASAAVSIENVPVLLGRDSRAHALLTVVAIVGILTIGGFWIRESWAGQSRALTALVGALVVGVVAVWCGQWMSLRRMMRPVPVAAPANLRVAAVTTFVGSLEPIAMLEYSVQAMLAMRGTHDTWVLDEENRDDVRAMCARLKVRHFSRRHRPEYRQDAGPLRAGTKHGNYNAWLTEVGYANYDVVAMFDPDHVPEPEYLQRTLGYFAVSDVAFVQPPQFYYNQPASFVARAAAEESYGYYSTHLMASYAVGHTVVIGSHGVHRTTALHGVGGLPAHDAEDLYLTMLYRAAEWRGIYVPVVLAMGTTPIDWAGYLGQQLRWSRSMIDLKLRVLPRLAGRLSAVEKVLNLAHGAFYLRALTIPVLYLVLAALVVRNEVPAFLRPAPVLAMCALFALLAVIDRFRQRFYLDPPRERGFQWRSSVMQLAKWPVFVRAVMEAVWGRRVTYLLTPKEGSLRKTRALAPVQLGVALSMLASLALGTLRHGSLETPLIVAATVVILVSLGIAWTDAAEATTADALALHVARRQAMRDGRPSSDVVT